MHSHNSVSIDEVKFLKTSKKLLNTLSTEHKLELKLSQMQEILAQSLGYRNLHDLQNVFTHSNIETKQHKNEIISSVYNQQIFKYVSFEQALEIIFNLTDMKDNMWADRAITLLSCVLKALIHMRDNEEIILSADVISNYLVLNNIIELYKTRKDFPINIRQDLKNYLFSLPGFQESAPKQNDIVYEQHGYLHMQFVNALSYLKNIENQQQKNEVISSSNTINIFKDIGVEQCGQIIFNLMDSAGSGDMWRGRSLSLLNAMLKTLIYMRDNKEIILSADLIRDSLLLDNIIKLYKTRKDFPSDVRQDLRAYLVSLPGFQESAPKQNDIVSEQHGYLQMQFLNPLNRLKNIENNNFIIADNNWFIYDTKERIVSSSMGKEKQITTETYQVFTINPLLHDFDFLEDSWLSMNEYEDWVANLFKKRKLKEIRVSDLLVYVTTIISPHRRNTMYLVLNSILNNYSIASQISAQITKKLKLNN